MEQVYYLYDTKPPRLVSPKSKRGVMTKTLQEIQQENRKFILEAIHGCSYEEALEKELGVNCKIILDVSFAIKNYDYTITDNDNFKINRDLITEIIGKPLTLSRVLLALKDKQIGFYWDSLGYIVSAGQDYGYYKEDEVEYICDWNLTIETLEEQTEKTQREINKLFND